MMFLMKAEADNRLNNNLTGGAALTVFSLASQLCLIFIADIISIFFETLMIDFTVFGDYRINSLLASLCGMVLVIALILPLKLGIKRWYRGINGEHLPLSFAFSYFKSWREYRNAVSYCLVKTVIYFISFALPLLPSIAIVAFLETRLNTENRALGVLVGTLIVLAVILGVTAMFYSLYIMASFLLCDYLYMEKPSNAVRAVILSQKMMKNNMLSLIKLIFSMIPYYIFCMALFPIPFIVPKIRTRFAVFADKTIEKYNGGQQCQF